MHRIFRHGRGGQNFEKFPTDINGSEGVLRLAGLRPEDSLERPVRVPRKSPKVSPEGKMQHSVYAEKEADFKWEHLVTIKL